ncbi:DNA alkylation repair protein [Viridibacillus arvi]|uniref:DNA alkylation repair protein n=1 Tax=Viridibacillus arvi TaxID=263475 RepID=UPI00381DDB5F
MPVSEDILNRKGARKASEIPNEVLELLNQGEIESVNLTEWLSIDHRSLVKSILPAIGLEEKVEFVISELEQQEAHSGMKAIRMTGALLDKVMEGQIDRKREETIMKCSTHMSDSVRCWATFMNKTSNDSLEVKLKYIEPFAADPHFGVREIAWMSIRENLSENIELSVNLLEEWAKSDDENIRRFSVESIRPRGVWTKHIETLKQDPHQALPILNILKSDSSKYVQDSVGNWLNDASKTQPEWVINVCEKWEKDSDTRETSRIIKKAKRTIMKDN